MTVDKYNLLKDVFYTSASRKTSLLMKDWKKDAVFLTEDEAIRYINRNINFIDYEDRIENWPSFPNPTF